MIDLRTELPAQDLESTTGSPNIRKNPPVRNNCFAALFITLMLVPGIMLFILLVGPLGYHFPFNPCFNFLFILVNMIIQVVIINLAYLPQVFLSLCCPCVLFCKHNALEMFELPMYQSIYLPGIFLIVYVINILYIAITAITVDISYVSCCQNTGAVNQSINDSLHLPLLLVNNSSIKRFIIVESNHTDYINSNNSCQFSFSTNSTNFFDVNSNSKELFKFQIWIIIVFICILLRLAYFALETWITWRMHWGDRQEHGDKFQKWLSVENCFIASCSIIFTPLSFILCVPYILFCKK